MSLVNIGSVNTTSTLENYYEDDVQPNGIDLRLDKVWWSGDDTFILHENDKEHRKKIQLHPRDLDKEYFHLSPGFYEISFKNNVFIGEDEAGYVITRSTLMRNGLFVVSGLYDSGYSGGMIAGLHVASGPTLIHKNAALAQLVIWKSQSSGSYDGSYGFNEDGTPKTDEKRYHV